MTKGQDNGTTILLGLKDCKVGGVWGIDSFLKEEKPSKMSNTLGGDLQAIQNGARFP